MLCARMRVNQGFEHLRIAGNCSTWDCLRRCGKFPKHGDSQKGTGQQVLRSFHVFQPTDGKWRARSVQRSKRARQIYREWNNRDNRKHRKREAKTGVNYLFGYLCRLQVVSVLSPSFP